MFCVHFSCMDVILDGVSQFLICNSSEETLGKAVLQHILENAPPPGLKYLYISVQDNAEYSTSIVHYCLALCRCYFTCPPTKHCLLSLTTDEMYTACRTQLAGSADALLNVYQQAMSGKGSFKLASDDELQLVEGLR